MLVPTPPMSNLQRQRLFRKRHPERDALYKARARIRMEMCSVMRWMATAEPLALPARPVMLALPAARPLALPAARVPLALPGPVETPAFIAPRAQPEPIPVSTREAGRLERRAANLTPAFAWLGHSPRS